MRTLVFKINDSNSFCTSKENEIFKRRSATSRARTPRKSVLGSVGFQILTRVFLPSYNRTSLTIMVRVLAVGCVARIALCPIALTSAFYPLVLPIYALFWIMPAFDLLLLLDFKKLSGPDGPVTNRSTDISSSYLALSRGFWVRGS